MKAKKTILMITAMMLIILQIVTASATEQCVMPEIVQQDKSLTVYYYIEKNGNETPIEGAKIEIYRVADLNCENGSAGYSLLPEYESLKKTRDGEDVTFEGLSGTESEKFSAELSKLVKNSYASAVTDSEGTAIFTSLPQGMYLVCETEATGEAKKYELFSPYIISVPLAVTEKEGNYWKYDVLSEPKTKTRVKENNSSVTSSNVSSTTTSTTSSTSSTTTSSSESSTTSSNVSSTTSSSESSTTSSNVSSTTSSNVSSTTSSSVSSTTSSSVSSTTSSSVSSEESSSYVSETPSSSGITSINEDIISKTKSEPISSVTSMSSSSKSESSQTDSSKSVISTILDTVGIKTGGAMNIIIPLMIMLIVGIAAGVLSKKKGEE